MFRELKFRRRFEASHRLYASKGIHCNNLHGHSFHATLCLTEGLGLSSGEVGYQNLFERLKKPFWKFLDERVDHSALLNKSDPLIESLSKTTTSPKILKFRADPTTEEIAFHFLVKFISLLEYDFGNLSHRLDFHSIGMFIEETPTNSVKVQVDQKDFHWFKTNVLKMAELPNWVFSK